MPPASFPPIARTRTLWIALFFVLLALSPARAAAEERITSFDVRATIAHPRTLTITERITYDFDNEGDFC